MTKQELAKKIKAQYPQYANIDDNTLADKILEKYPVYQAQITGPGFTPPQANTNALTGISQSAKERFGDIKETWQKTASGEISPLRTGIRTTGDVIGLGGDVLFNVIKEGVRAISPQAVEKVKGAVSKVGETEVAQNVLSAYSSWAEKNPEAARDLGSVLNIASVVPLGKGAQVGTKLATKGVQATEAGIQATSKAVGKGVQAIGVAGEKTGKALVSAAIPPKEVAARVLAYKAKNPLAKRFQQAMEGIEKAPITPADAVIKYNLIGPSRTSIGVRAKRMADELFNNQVKPVLNGITDKVKKADIFTGIQKKINNVKDISRRKSLQNAFDALADDYSKVSSWSVKTLDEIKSGMASRLPSKVWKGQDIAGDMNNVRKMFADEARTIVRSKLPAPVIAIYDDYGALKEVMKMGEKAIQAGVNTNMNGLMGEVWRAGATPLLTGIGTGVSKLGTGIKKLGTKLKGAKTKLKAGLSIEDVSKPLPKGKGEILKSTPLKKSPLIEEAKKYKSAEEGAYYIPDDLKNVHPGKLSITPNVLKEPRGSFKLAIDANVPNEIKPVLVKAFGDTSEGFKKSVVKSKLVDVKKGLEYMKKNNISLDDVYKISRKELAKPVVPEPLVATVKTPEHIKEIDRTISRLLSDADTGTFEAEILMELSKNIRKASFTDFKQMVNLIRKSEVGNYIKEELTDIIIKYQKKAVKLLPSGKLKLK